jgi:hypothetical protein
MKKMYHLMKLAATYKVEEMFKLGCLQVEYQKQLDGEIKITVYGHRNSVDVKHDAMLETEWGTLTFVSGNFRLFLGKAI